VVLSGGGAKAAAHVGAVRALLAAGLTPTRYVGTSMGAVIACAFAAGLSPDEVEARLLAVRQRDILRLDRSILLRGIWGRSLFRALEFREALDRLLPVTHFAELQLPLSITATDLDTGELVVFGAGGLVAPLLDPLCASCALPPFLPPHLVEGRRCADGGLRAVVPLEVAAQFPAELVVAVDVGAGFDMEEGGSGRTLPWLLRYQSEAQRVLMASNTAAQHELWLRTAGRPPLLWIRPRVRKSDTFALAQLTWYIAEGERAATAALGARRP
jgi:NTE family protein